MLVEAKTPTKCHLFIPIAKLSSSLDSIVWKVWACVLKLAHVARVKLLVAAHAGTQHMYLTLGVTWIWYFYQCGKLIPMLRYRLKKGMPLASQKTKWPPTQKGSQKPSNCLHGAP